MPTIINTKLRLVHLGAALQHFWRQFLDEFAPHFPLGRRAILEADFFDKLDVLHAFRVCFPRFLHNLEIDFPLAFLLPLDFAFVLPIDDDNLLVVFLDDFLSCEVYDSFDVLDDMFLEPALDRGEKKLDLPTFDKLDLELADNRFEEIFTAFDDNDSVGVRFADRQEFEDFGSDDGGIRLRFLPHLFIDLDDFNGGTFVGDFILVVFVVVTADTVLRRVYFMWLGMRP